MADVLDLAEKLKPLMLDDKAFQEELKRTVVLDVDTKDAEKSFSSMRDKLDNLNDAIRQAKANAQDATSLTENLGKMANAATSIIEEKICKIGELIKEAQAQNAMLSSKMGNDNLPMTNQLKKDYEESKRVIEAREKLLAEYTRQNQELAKANQSNVETSQQQEQQVNKKPPQQSESALKLGQAMSEADTSWITKEKMSAEELKETYESLLEEKKNIESQKSVSSMSETELKDYAQVLASLNKIANMRFARSMSEGMPTGGKAKKDSARWSTRLPTDKSEKPKTDNINWRTYDAKTQDYVNASHALPLEKKDERPGGKELLKGVGDGVEATISSYRELEDEINRLTQLTNSMRYNLSLEGLNPEAWTSGYAQLQQQEAQLKKLLQIKKNIDSESKVEPAKLDIKSYDELEVELERLKTLADNLRNSLATYSFDGNAWEVGINTLRTLDAQIKELERTKKSLDTGKETEIFKANPQNYQELVAWIDTLKNKIGDMSRGIQDGTSTNIEKDNEEIKEYSNELKRLEAIKKQVDTGASLGDNAPPTRETRGFVDVLKDAFQTKSKLAQEKTLLPFSNDVDGAQERIKALEKRMKGLNAIMNNVKSTSIVQTFSAIKTHAKDLMVSLGSKLWDGFQSGLKSLKSGINSAIGALKNLATNGLDMVKNGITNALGAIRNLATSGMRLLSSATTSAFGAMKNLASNGFNAVKSGISSLKSGLISLQRNMKTIVKKSTPNMLKSLTSLKSMLMRRVKRTFISAIFNQVKLGLQSLAKYSEEFNMAMSNIKNSAKQLAGNFAVTLGNLITALEPIITHVVNLISQLMTYINAFFSLLRGGSGTVTVAKKSTDDYAKSLDKASKSANNALSKFDELNVIGQESSDNNNDIEYEEVPIGEALGGLNGLFDKMLDAIKGERWREVGQAVGELVNHIVTIIDEKIQGLRPLAEKWARNIAEILNGVVDGVNFTNIGKTIGDGVNLVTNTLNNFFKTFDFKNLGSKFAEGINSIFNTVEWDALGELLARRMMAIWHTLEGLFTNLDWGNIGRSLSQMMNNLFENIDFVSMANTVSSGINGVFEAIRNFSNNLNLESYATNFGKYINDVFTKIKWEDIANTLSQSVNKVVASAFALIKEINWSDIGRNIGNFFFKTFNGIDWKNLGKTVSELFNGVLTSLLSATQAFSFADLAKNVTEGLEIFRANIEWDKISKLFTTSINEVLKAFNTFVTGIQWEQLAKDVFSTLTQMVNGINWDGEGGLTSLVSTGVNTVVDVFNEFVTSDVLTNLATNLGKTINGIFKEVKFKKLASTARLGLFSISSAFSSFIEKLNLSEIASNIADGLNSFFLDAESKDIFKKLADNVGEGIKGIADGFSTFVETLKIEEIANTLGETVGTILDKINWETLAKSVTTGITKIVSAFGGFVSRLHLGIKAKSIASGINKFFSEKDKEGKTPLERAAASASGGIQSILGAFTTFLTDLDLDSIAESISKSIQTFFKEVDINTVVGRVTDFVGNVVTEMGKIATSLLSPDESNKTLGDRIADAFNSLFADKNGNARTDMFSGIGSALSSTISGLFSNLKDLFDKINLSAIKEDILAFLKSIDWSDILSKLFSFIGSLIGTAIRSIGNLVEILVEWLSSINWLDVAMSIVGGIIGVIGDALQSVLDSIGGILGTIWKAIFGESKQMPSIWDGDWTENWEERAEAVGARTGRRFKDGLSTELQEANSLFNEDTTKHWNEAVVNALGIAGRDGLLALEETLKEFNVDDDTYKYIIDKVIKITDVEKENFAEAMAELGYTLTNDFADTLYDATVTDKEALAYALKLLGQGVNESTLEALDMANMNENLNNFMAKTGKELSDVATILMSDNKVELAEIARELGIEVGEDLGSITPMALKKALLEGKQSVQEAADELASIADQSSNQSSMEQNATEAGQATAEAVGSGQEEAIGDVEEATGKVTNAVQEKYEKLPEDVKPYAEQLMEYIMTALADKDGTVVSAIEAVAQGAVDRAKEILSGGAGLEIATTFLNAIRDGLEENMNIVTDKSKVVAENIVGTVKTYVGETYSYPIAEELLNGIAFGLDTAYSNNLESFAFNIADALLMTFRNHASYWNGYNISYNVMQGMADGLSKNAEAVINIGTNMASDLIKNIKKVLQIKSPSRAFAEIGDYSMQGLMVGLEGQEGNVLHSISNIASAITEEMSGDTSLGYTFDGVTGGLDSVVNSLSDVASQFVAVADAIKSMGGLAIPTIAEGRTIPYSTRIADTQDELGDMLNEFSSNLDSSNKDQIALLIEQNNLLRGLLEKQFTVNVTPSASWGRHNAQSMQMYTKLTGG